MFLFQEKQFFHFMHAESQTARMFIATKQSTHPLIFVYTDLEQNFIIFNTETKQNTAAYININTYFLDNIEETVGFISSWLNVCSNNANCNTLYCNDCIFDVFFREKWTVRPNFLMQILFK